MSTIKIIAKRIPDAVRSEILLSPDDPIENAISVKDNKEMKLLLKIWFEFVEPNSEPTTCPVCIGNILTNFKQMKGELIEMEKAYRMLKTL